MDFTKSIRTTEHTQLAECRPLHCGAYVCLVCSKRGGLAEFKADDCKPTFQGITSGWRGEVIDHLATKQ